MSKYLILPLFAMVLLTFVVALIMLRTRIRAVLDGTVKLAHFRTFSEGTPSEDMLKVSQHFTNLFELPVLFYAALLAAMHFQVQGSAIHVWAWLFVAARVAHAYIHIGRNRVRPRMYSFLSAWFCVMAIWVIVVMQALRA